MSEQAKLKDGFAKGFGSIVKAFCLTYVLPILDGIPLNGVIMQSQKLQTLKPER